MSLGHPSPQVEVAAVGQLGVEEGCDRPIICLDIGSVGGCQHGRGRIAGLAHGLLHTRGRGKAGARSLTCVVWSPNPCSPSPGALPSPPPTACTCPSGTTLAMRPPSGAAPIRAGTVTTTSWT